MIHRFTRIVLLRVRSLFRRHAVERELDDELRAFADELTARGRASGLGEAEARAAALRQMGSVIQVKEQAREAWGVTRLDELRRDARYAVRALGRGEEIRVVSEQIDGHYRDTLSFTSPDSE